MKKRYPRPIESLAVKGYIVPHEEVRHDYKLKFNNHNQPDPQLYGWNLILHDEKDVFCYISDIRITPELNFSNVYFEWTKYEWLFHILINFLDIFGYLTCLYLVLNFFLFFHKMEN